MALTEKGSMALNYINKFFADGTEFCAASLSDKAGEKIVAATFSPLVKGGFLERLGGSPVMFKTTNGFNELFEAIKDEVAKKGCDNTNLRTAARIKDDEFYTFYEDIETEVMKYRKYFKGKVVYLPCDDPLLNNNTGSEFWNFFEANFMNFGLKKLIATHYSEDGDAYKIWIENDVNDDGYIDGDDVLQEDLKGNGDFRSPECCEILKESDIVVTNPPFSMLKEFIPWILTAEKKLLIIGNENCYSYKEIFPLIKDNKVWTGYNTVKKFKRPDGSIKKFGNVRWLTNLPTSKREESLVLTKVYNEFDYPTYDNYDAIEVGKVVNIPKDYDGIMGVPITFINVYNPDQFEIIDINPHFFTLVAQGLPKPKQLSLKNVGRKDPYARILIRYKK